MIDTKYGKAEVTKVFENNHVFCTNASMPYKNLMVKMDYREALLNYYDVVISLARKPVDL